MTTQYKPPHPGEFIRKTYIEPLNISLRQVARDLDVAASTFSRTGSRNCRSISCLQKWISHVE